MVNEEIELSSLLLGNEIITSSVLVKRSIITKGFTEKQSTTSAEDYELWLRLASSNKVYRIGEPLVLFRKHENTSSFDYGLKYIEMLREVIKILSSYENNLNKKVRKFARYGVVKQEKELCKVLYKNSQYTSFFLETISLFKNVFLGSFLISFTKKKLFKMDI